MMIFYLFYLSYIDFLGFFCFFIFFCYFFIFNSYSGVSLSLFFNADFMGFGLCVLTVFIFFMMLMSGCFDSFKDNNWKILLFLINVFFIMLIFVFFSSNFFLFYFFFELVVIPIFIMIIGWGYSLNRVQAAYYMFFYTFISSLPMLINLLVMFINNFSFFFIFNFYSFLNKTFYGFLWVFIILVFMVKLPLFIFHLWLPKAHVDAPLLGSMVLAGVLLKMGGYGVYKSLVYLSEEINLFSWFFSVFSIWGGCLMGLVCIRQIDLKSLIAYSSVVHMGPVFGVFYLMTFSGLMGAYWMMFSHGLCSSCLFFLLNLIYMNLGSRSLFMVRGGLFFTFVLSIFWFLFSIINMGFPPSFNFFSEFALMTGAFSYSYMLMVLFSFLLMVSGFYSVMMYMYMNHGFMKFFYLGFYFSLKDLSMVLMVLLFLVGFLFFMFFFC